MRATDSTPNLDPDEWALAAVKQYLAEHGWTRALEALEGECGTRYNPHQLPRASELLDLACRGFLAEVEGLSGDANAAARRASLAALEALPRDVAPPLEPLHVVRDAHSVGVTCVALLGAGDGGGSRRAVSGAADGSLAVTDVVRGEVLATAAVARCGLLCLAVQSPSSGSLVAGGCMDGSLVVVDAGHPPAHPSVLAECLGAHRKYAVTAAWTEDGALLLSGGWDGTVALHAWDPTLRTLRTLCRLPCSAQVESVVRWGGPPSSPSSRFLAAVRGSTALLEFVVLPQAGGGGGRRGEAGAEGVEAESAALGPEQLEGPSSPALAPDASHSLAEWRLGLGPRHSLNEDPEDPHLSFSAMALAVSPCGGFLAAATDAGRVLIMGPGDARGTLRPLRRCFGLPLDRFQTWTVGWGGAGLVMAGGAGGVVHAFLAATGECLGVVRAHSPANVRGLATAPQDSLLLTCSFDGTLRIFS